MTFPPGTPLLCPRRRARLLLRLEVRVEVADGAWDAVTEDLSAQGCRLAAPAPLLLGQPVRLRFGPIVPPLYTPFTASGRVVWSGHGPPYLLGIAFAPPRLESTARWLGRLLSSRAEAPPMVQVPARIEPDAPLHLGAPPRLDRPLSLAEVRVLRHVGLGTTLDELSGRLELERPEAERALFSLLARRALETEVNGPLHLTGWRRLLSEVEDEPTLPGLELPRRRR